ncbi:putative DNA primase/helicase [Bathymodiolus platifrons methanotrophic gill symbiont]|uniref:virulence-associated E family protein n=1 Tax=Bathymodiolus platifrons methanotrophic gill symbiont TaxID=113268 RepID=UPI001B688C3F|nr:virulence-associated E family protein [Bathymodiolus platifrons methanotrophic gill symbiont]GFO75319.1 putative DNA primase/helicase [Bathymodiolus platifrons methanotrophic gill symbiont]
MLVLGGDQGLHKTSFIKYLLPAELHKYIKDSVRLDTKDRDSMLNILRCWIPELADLDPALKKKGLPELKGFLAQARHATSRKSGTPVAVIRSPTQRIGDAPAALRPPQTEHKAAQSWLPQMALRLFGIKF